MKKLLLFITICISILSFSNTSYAQAVADSPKVATVPVHQPTPPPAPPVSNNAAKTQPPHQPAASNANKEPKYTFTYFTAQEVQLIAEVIDASTAPHVNVKQVIKFMNERLIPVPEPAAATLDANKTPAPGTATKGKKKGKK